MRTLSIQSCLLAAYAATNGQWLVDGFQQPATLNFSARSITITTAGTSSAVTKTGATAITSGPSGLTKLSTSKSVLKAAVSTEDEPPKCPVTLFALRVQKSLSILDKKFLKRVLRITNHAPALLSLSYFGLVSMASMMSMGPMAAQTGPAQATLASVLTRAVGSTTNAEFAALFPTYVTPAPFVFLVWPTIAILQLLTVTVSAIYPEGEEEILTQNDLSALTLANLASTFWLLTASNAMSGSLPVGSFLILPFVPLFSGFTLRNKPSYVLWAYQLFSSFTTLASILAFTVELQHGGRIPIIGKLSAEVAACIFLSLYSAVSLGVKEKSGVKRFVNFFALSGIIVRRFSDALVGSSFFGALGGLLLSVSFLGTIGCWYWSLKELFTRS